MASDQPRTNPLRLPLPANIPKTGMSGEVVGQRHPVLASLDLSESAFVVAVAQGMPVIKAKRLSRLPDDYRITPLVKQKISELRTSIGQAQLMGLPIVLTELWKQYSRADAAEDTAAAANILMKIVTVAEKTPSTNKEAIDALPEFDTFDDEADPETEDIPIEL